MSNDSFEPANRFNPSSPSKVTKLDRLNKSTSPVFVSRWPWNPLQAVVIVVATFIVSQFLALGAVVGGATLYAQLTGASDRDVNTWLNDGTTSQFAIIFLAETFVVLCLWLLLRKRKLPFRQLGFGRPVAKDFWLPVLTAGVYLAALLIVVALLQQFVPGLDVAQEQDIGFDGATGFVPLLLVFLALVVCAPVAEEILFRGFLFGSLRHRSSFVAATVGTSVLFGAAHLMGGEQGASLLWIAGIDTLLLSFALCYLREKTGRLWAPIMLHAMKNGLAFVFLFIV